MIYVKQWLITSNFAKNLETSNENLCMNVVILFSIIVCCLVVTWCFINSILSKLKHGHKQPFGGAAPLARRVARIWKRGGYFDRVRSVQTTLTRIFIELESVSGGFHWNFSESSEIQRFFSAENQVFSKKKKGLHWNWEWFFGRNPKFKGFFRPNSGVLQKKKRSSPKLRLIFRPISQIQTFEGGLFSYGGAIFNFSQKIGLKSTKNMRFCILHEPMGGLEPPAPPGYATALGAL